MIDDSTLRFLEPGLYAGPDGTLHVDATEYLEANGYEATAENLEIICYAFRKSAACPVHVIDAPSQTTH